MPNPTIHKKLLRFLYKKANKTLIDKYLLVFGIKVIQTNTLFPICINQSSEELEKFINKYAHLKSKMFQKLRKMEYPIFNRFSLLNIKKHTLVPIGTLTFISHLHESHRGVLKKYLIEHFGNNSHTLIKEHRNIRTITPLTLVPITFIYGSKGLKYQYGTSVNSTFNRSTESNRILKDPLMVTYLKMIGLQSTNIPTATMVPLGKLLTLHYIYNY